jgi:hypothetical protein
MSEPHDYQTVFTGSENQVGVHNLVPGSSYRVRLRAGDYEDGNLATVVDRASLPFTTPTWQHVMALETSTRADSESSHGFDIAAASRPSAGMHQQSAPAPRSTHHAHTHTLQPHVIQPRHAATDSTTSAPTAAATTATKTIPLRPLRAEEPHTTLLSPRHTHVTPQGLAWSRDYQNAHNGR